MKNIKNILTLLACIACFSSCEYRVELDGLNQNEKLFAECLINERDTCFLRIQRTTPSNQNPKMYSIEDPAISFAIGKEKCQFLKLDEETSDKYYYVGKARVGDEISLSIEVQGIKKISSTDVVPSLPDYTVSTNLKDPYTLSHRITFHNHGESHGFYGIRLSKKQVKIFKIKGDREYYQYDTVESMPELFDERFVHLGDYAISNNMENGDEFFTEKINGQKMILVEDNGFDPLTITAFSDYQKDKYNQFGKECDTLHTSYKFMLQVFRLSESCYRYLKAHYQVSRNMGAKYNLAAPSFAFTNIFGGYGVLGCLSQRETGWMQNYNPLPPLKFE